MLAWVVQPQEGCPACRHSRLPPPACHLLLTGSCHPSGAPFTHVALPLGVCGARRLTEAALPSLCPLRGRLRGSIGLGSERKSLFKAIEAQIICVRM